MRQARWLYPAVNTAHILGLATLYGSLVVLHLRAPVDAAGATAPGLDKLVTPVAASGFAIAVVSGLLMFTTDAVKYAGASLFLIKMALILGGACKRGLAETKKGSPTGCPHLVVCVDCGDHLRPVDRLHLIIRKPNDQSSFLAPFFAAFLAGAFLAAAFFPSP
jgi:hypothetical protein